MTKDIHALCVCVCVTVASLMLGSLKRSEIMCNVSRCTFTASLLVFRVWLLYSLYDHIQRSNLLLIYILLFKHNQSP